MRLPSLLEGDTPSVAAGALLYTFGRSLVSITEPPHPAFHSVSQKLHQPGQAAAEPFRCINLASVALHNGPESAWLIIRDKVYDVTDFWTQHPGGKVILTYAGRDATDVFATFHSSSTWSQLKPLCIGRLRESDSSAVTPALLSDFRAMRAEFLRDGLFRSSKLFYAWKVASNFTILGAALVLLSLAETSWLSFVGSACLLATFWQQSGWLAHDFLHHQVWADRHWNKAWGYFLGNVSQGFSVDWWVSKHNTHHAAPNELEGGSNIALDPDIDTLPILSWSVEQLQGTRPTLRWLLRYQQFYFLPILLLARLTWAQQSFAHAYAILERGEGWHEVMLLGLHYSWVGGLCLAALSPAKAICFFILAQCLSGFLLSIVFVQSHNGMTIHSAPTEFVTAQIMSTRDILSSAWTDWFTGGLNYQVEHHLFPTLPRHNLWKVQQRVRRFCSKHGLTYEICSMAESTQRVLQCLADVGKAAGGG